MFAIDVLKEYVEDSSNDSEKWSEHDFLKHESGASEVCDCDVS